MNILTLTSSEAVRAVIGVSDDSGELQDQTLIDLRIADLLLLELSTWLPKTVIEIETEASASDDETSRASLAYLALKAAATYYCASVVLESGELSFVERYEDGQNKMKRQAFEVSKLHDRLMGKYLDYKQQVLTYTESEAEIFSTRWMAGRSTPSYDPVTNS
jgi:hypothetical protein